MQVIATFGFSVRDFTTTISLLKDLIEAFQETGGGSDRFFCVIRELWEVERFYRALGSSKKVWVVSATSSHRTGCSAVSISPGFSRFCGWVALEKRYEDGFEGIQWTLCKKKDAQAFMATLQEHISSISVLLGLMQAFCDLSLLGQAGIFVNVISRETTHKGFRRAGILESDDNRSWTLFLSTHRSSEATDQVAFNTYGSSYKVDGPATKARPWRANAKGFLGESRAWVFDPEVTG